MLASHKGEIPFVVYLLPFLGGIGLALSADLSVYRYTIIGIFIALATVFVLLNVLYRRMGLHRKQWVGGVLAYSILVLAGITCTLNFDDRNHAAYFEHQPAGQLLVKVNSEPQLKNGFLRFTGTVEESIKGGKRNTVNGNLLLVLRTDSTNIGYGDVLLIPANYTPIDPPFNPAEFNYKQYLAYQNIYAQQFLDPKQVVVLSKGAGNPVMAYALQLRQKLVGQFKQYLHSAEAISVASTLILGYKAELDNDILQAYSKTGTIHVLSVSGAHVAIIFAFISLLLGFLDRYKYGKIINAVISIVLIWYYSLLTGLSPAVCRAAVMISLIIIGKTYSRRINTLNILAVSAFLILLFDPFLLIDVGFQLSYLAVAGLIVFQPIVYHWLDIENKWLDKLWLLCSASIAAQAITFPLSAYYFHQFPVYFLLSNLFILVPSFVIMYAGIVFLVIAQFGRAMPAKWVGWVLEKSILLMDKGLQLMEQAPYASIGKIWISRGEYLLLFVLVLLLFALCYYKRPVFLKLMMVCTLILAVCLSMKRIGHISTNNITFFNLKKHPAILFEQGSRAVLITDLADTDKNYRYSIQPCLDSNRVSQLTVIPFNKDISTPYLLKRGSLVRFLGKDMVILDKGTILKPLSPGITVDGVFITGSPHFDPQLITNNFTYRYLVIGANNSDRLLDTMKRTIANNDKKMYVLKRNRSVIVKSN